MASLVGERPARNVHRLRYAYALHRSQRKSDRRVSSGYANDGRVWPVISLQHRYATQQRGWAAGVLWSVHSKHAQRFRAVRWGGRDCGFRTVTRSSGCFSTANADLAGRTELFRFQIANVERQHALVHHRARRWSSKPPRDAPEQRTKRDIEQHHYGRESGVLHYTNH